MAPCDARRVRRLPRGLAGRPAPCRRRTLALAAASAGRRGRAAWTASALSALAAVAVAAAVAALVVAAAALPGGPRLAAEDLPVDRSALEALGEKSGGLSGITNLLSLEQVQAAIAGGQGGLSVDFSHVTKLLDGTAVAREKIYGTAYTGPYPFESREVGFVYKRFRLEDAIRLGKGTLTVGSLLKAPVNSEGWTDGGEVAVRLVLFLEQPERDRSLGVYDTTVAFHRAGSTFERRPSLVEGPFVNLLTSDSPSEAVITFVTSEQVRAHVSVRGRLGGKDDGTASFYEELSAKQHEIALSGLEADRDYSYRVQAGSIETRDYRFRTAPRRGAGAGGGEGGRGNAGAAAGPVTFAYLGDTRAGPGGGLNSFMGVNHDTVNRLAELARARGARFLTIGGDLVSGYTTVPEDFATQLHAWRQAVTGFWSERPIYAAMGNHEALLRAFEGVNVDRWPYDTQSAEAVFSTVFVHPRNGPRPSDPRRPTYAENVYSFHFGPVKLIAFNNNYWVSYAAEKYGGSPEGYILKDQLDWIRAELDDAEKDPAVSYLILFAQEPVFPNGGHVGDAMWAGGDNRTRAHVFKDGAVLPEEDGLLAVRNKLVRLVASCRKAAAVLGADEHAYHRTLIGKDVPIGDIEADDRNRNARIDLKAGEKPSPLADLRYSAWYIVSGGGGAPYYSEEKTPWSEHWAGRKAPRSGRPGFFFSSQENVLLFEAGPDGISCRALNPHGELIDEIPNLMADKE